MKMVYFRRLYEHDIFAWCVYVLSARTLAKEYPEVKFICEMRLNTLLRSTVCFQVLTLATA